MEEKKNNTQPQPTSSVSVPRRDVDDLIFREEIWPVSDR